MKNNNYRNLVLLLVGSLLLRLLFIYPQYSGDVKNHFVWAQSFLEEPVGFYQRHFSGFNDANYPPLAIFLFSFFYSAHQSINQLFSHLNQSFSFFPSFLVPLFQSENMSFAFLKFPGIIADLVIGTIIYLWQKKYSPKNALFFSALFLLNPAVIYVSSVWGQTESVTAAFLLLSFYLAKDKPYLSMIAFFMTVLTKQTGFWFAPFFLLYFIKQNNFQTTIKSLLIGIVLFFVSYLPFGLLPILAVKNYISTLSGSSTVVSDAAWNLWYFFYPQGTNDSTLILNIISVRNLSIVTILASLFMILRRSANMFYALFWWSILVFFLQTRVHERHLAFALPLLLLIPDVPKGYLLTFLVVSIYHLLNLYSSLGLPFI